MNKMQRRRQKTNISRKATDIIDELLDTAKSHKGTALEKTAIRKALDYGKRHRISLGTRKHLFCKKCFKLYDTKTKVRIKNNIRIITCSCGTIKRIGFTKAKKQVNNQA